MSSCGSATWKSPLRSPLPWRCQPSPSGVIEMAVVTISAPRWKTRNVVCGAGCWRRSARAPMTAARALTVLLAGGLDREADLHVVADEESAGLERRVPLQPEVLAVDCDLGLEADLVVAPRILGRAEMRDGQRDLFR